MHEGVLVWHKGGVAVQYFDRGELIFAHLKVGQEVELFQNGYWHKVKIRSNVEEPYIEDWNYGNCLGCDVRFSEQQV